MFVSLYLFSLFPTNSFAAVMSSGPSGTYSDNTFPVCIHILTKQTKTQWPNFCENFPGISSLQMHLVTHNIQNVKEFHLIPQRFNTEVNSEYIFIPVTCIQFHFVSLWISIF